VSEAGPITTSMSAPSASPRGATIWLTGLPSAGKTTVATALAQRLQATGVAVEILDGDAVRPVLSPELGYSRPDRDANVARIGWVAALLARNGVVVIAAVVSPFAAARDGVRAQHVHDGSSFFEVHIATPVDVCAARDVKGLYARQRTGEVAGLTGVDDEYEPPLNPELVIDTSVTPLEESVERLVAMLEPQSA
jgi:adenylylsulfate kinase